MNRLKKTLDRFYREFDFQARLLRDPIEFPHRYRDPRDIEITAFVSACLAYGKVDLFKPVLERLFSRMGTSPADFIVTEPAAKKREIFSGIKYRFNENEDILALFHILQRILKTYGSLENVFKRSDNSAGPTIGQGLTGLTEALRGIDTSAVYGNNLKPPGLLQFLPSPAAGSACKRLNLFLRWMVRDRDIDFGIWKDIPANRLIIPLDTHIARISRCLGLTARSSQDWKMAVEITDALKRFDPVDPLKYDFALCHHGISGACRGRKDKESCRGCILDPGTTK